MNTTPAPPMVPYVCLEPWCSLPSRQGEIAVFTERADLIRLELGGAYENCWTIAPLW